MSLLTAVYDRLKTISNTTVSPELRRLGDPTPAVNYTVEWSWSLAMDGSRTEYREATVRAQCFADTLLVAEARAESVAGRLEGKWTQGNYSAICITEQWNSLNSQERPSASAADSAAE